MSDTRPPTFWRDDALPFLEARFVADGRKVCYDRHFHDTFSIGAITGGRSTYINGRRREAVGAGAVVVMNPGEVHACNPIADQPWSYTMLYVDRDWLGSLQQELGLGADQDLRALGTTLTTDALLFRGLNDLGTVLLDADSELLQKQSAAVEFFCAVQLQLDPAAMIAEGDHAKLRHAAEFISDNRTEALTLAQICSAAELSPSYLIRAFKRRYGMTPHAYLINRRVQYGQSQLRRGRAIAEVALDAGFADQAHFQRAFKRLLAATPRQYRA